jgi:hypothetical protein
VPTPVPFWLQPFSTLGLSSFTLLSQRSPGGALSPLLAPSSVAVLTDTSLPRGSAASRLTVGTLSEGSVQVVTFLHIFVGYR